MKITALVENTSISEEYSCKHGLCLYIEACGHKILFDLGPDDSFLHNARKMNIDIADVDMVVLSHGHSDHGGAMQSFLQHNSKAKIYIQAGAFNPYYARVLFGKVPIGLDAALQNNSRLVIVQGEYKIADGLLIFADVQGTACLPRSSKVLLVKKDGRYVQDDFSHEQNLLITENGRTVLLSGCSHRGIVNIMQAACGHTPKVDYAVGGFHMYNTLNKRTESNSLLEQLAQRLQQYDTIFYTCHCTGTRAYKILKAKMAGQIEYLSTGASITI